MRIIRLILGPALVLLLAMKADNPFISNLINKIKTYAINYAPERVYVYTDKTLYKGGDNIWFRAYIFNSLEKKLSLLSHSLYYKVFGPDSKELISGKSYIQNGICDGSIKIPSKWKEGRYILIYYSSWMKNQSPDQIFQKEIYLKNGDFTSLRIRRDSTYKLLKIGKFATFNGQLSFTNGNILPTQQMTYIISTRGKIAGNGKFTTDAGGNFSIQVKIENFEFSGNWLLEVDGKLGKEKLFGISPLPWLVPPVTISFIPEGGNLIDGNLNIIAVSGHDRNGNAFPIKGIINDSKGEAQANINTENQKWGKVELNAIKGEKYWAKIISPLGIDDAFFLPEVKKSGVMLHLLSTDSNYMLMRIASFHRREPRIYIAARWGSRIFWAADIDLSEERNISIPIVNLPAGVADVFLIDSSEALLAFRPTFINNSKQARLVSKIERNSYKIHEKVVVEFSLKDLNNKPLDGILSASVSQWQVPIVYNELPSFFYLKSNSDCTFNNDSYAEPVASFFFEPAYNFFSTKDNIMSSALYSASLPQTAYSSMEGISGLVLSDSNSPVANSLVGFINTTSNQVQQTKCNAKGEFSFNLVTPSATKQEFKLFATTINNKEKLNIHIDGKYENDLSQYLLSLGLEMPARNSDISNSMKIVDKRTQFQRYLSQSRSLLDIIMQMKHYTIANNQIFFTGMMNSIDFQPGALIVINGTKMGTDVSALNSVIIDEVADVNIYTNVSDILRYTGVGGFGGVIDIRLKKREDLSQSNLTSSKVYYLMGYSVAETFNSPDYSSQEMNSQKMQDSRTTLLWQPDIKLDKEGKTTIQFYTSDKKGRFTGIVQGLANNGSPVYGSFEFDVK
jgi:hypothetical protein